MPRRRDPALIEPETLTAMAIDRVGGVDADLARELAKLGLDPVSTAKNIGRWRKGEHAPDYTATVALLQVAGLLSDANRPIDKAEQLVRLRDAGVPVPAEELEQAAGDLQETARLVRRLADLLRGAARDARSGS